MFGARARKTAGAFAVLAGLTVAGGACGGDDDTTATGGEGAQAAAPTSLTIAFGSKLQTLDPDLILDPTGNVTLHLIGATLLEATADGSAPGLAESAEPSDDGLTWTITLKPGLAFSDGTPLSSADVKATFDRNRNDKANVNPTLWQPIRAVEAPDDTTVTLRLTRPYPSLEQVLTYPQFTIFPAGSVGKKSFYEAPVSAGPYVLDSWGGSNTVKLSANPAYPGSKPVTASVTLETVPDANSQLAQVQSGQIDIAYTLPPNLASQITAPAIRAVTPLYGLQTLTMRTTAAPLDDVRVRKAIAAAIDRSQLSQTVWTGAVKPLAGLWPSTMSGHDASWSTARDVEGAKASLAGTACASGCKLDLTYSSETYPEQQLEAPIVQANLKDIGIDVQLNNVDAATYYTALGGDGLQLGLAPLFDFADIPDGITTYGLLEGSATNFSRFGLPGVDRVVARANEATGDARPAALAAVSDLLTEHMPWTPLTDRGQVSAARLPASVVAVLPSSLVGVVREDGDVR
ncbi:MAG: ABC transporter substrate-binding protein [Thermoleophilia bacterium]|nr:ABC transporter substrate-binding protein [Thermoleophilia bacterium]